MFRENVEFYKKQDVMIEQNWLRRIGDLWLMAINGPFFEGQYIAC